MGIPVLVMGNSGSGKSTSMRNFDDIGLINVLGKPLPFRNGLKPVRTDDYDKVKAILCKANANSIAIDDAGYLMTNQFMRGHSKAGSGNGIFAFYNDVGDQFWGLLDCISNTLPENKIVYLMMHEDKNELGDVKPKTLGRMLDEKVCVEGMFTVVLRSVFEDGKYQFKTNTDGNDVCKSPIGMFEKQYIDNDLLLVDSAIREYWNIKDKKEGKSK